MPDVLNPPPPTETPTPATTPTDYANLPDREIDALIAVRLFGWRWFLHKADSKVPVDVLYLANAPSFDEDANVTPGIELFAMWKRYMDSPFTRFPRHTDADESQVKTVRDALNRRGWTVGMFTYSSSSQWQPAVQIERGEGQERFRHSRPSAVADTLPRALCIAALKALDAEEAEAQ